MTAAIRISEEVRHATEAGRPVVALESTIITHGLPRPRNLEVAVEAEGIVRELGAVPATIGVVAGVATIGLSGGELEQLAEDPTVVKASVRDLPILAAKGLSGGTTVAATAYLAHRAGIRVFSTGGLGGVHRGAEHTFDESADLPALAELPIVLISAGVKSILDIPLTLERLETLGLTVVGYRTTDYPGFYVADSGYDIDYSVSGPDEVAAMAASRDQLGLKGAILLAKPVSEADQLPVDLHQEILAKALASADDAGVAGHDITPYLLDYIQRETGGRSLDVNVAVYRGNVALGARVAAAISAR
jgi:pseudouridine-5'-phosphate glycosidase